MTKTPEGIEVIEEPQRGRRRRFTAEEKRRRVAEASEAGSSISLVARRNGISSSWLFRWRRLMEQGELESLGADEQVVPLSEAKQLRARVRELERLLGKKTLEAEILKEALELARSKKLLLRSHWPDGGDSK
jgi:transposase